MPITYNPETGKYEKAGKPSGRRTVEVVGIDGVDGKDGRDGIDGKDGKDGRDGKDGAQGPKGDKGDTGPAGRDGKDGKDGKNGKDGRDGKDGITPEFRSTDEVVEVKTSGDWTRLFEIPKAVSQFASGGGRFRFKDLVSWFNPADITADYATKQISIVGGGSDIAAKDEGTTLTTAMTSINFVGSGVGATNSGGDVTVTVSGGTPGGSSGQVQFNNAGAFGGFGSWSGTALGVPGTVTATYTTDSVLRDAFTTFPNTASRNDANFVIGHTFIPAVSMSVSQLGRLYVAGNTQNHQIGIWRRSTGALIASGTVLAATPSDANGFKYVSITPVTLDPAIEYIIAAQEFAAGDTWRDLWDSTGFYNGYVKRTGFAFIGSASFVVPTNFASGANVYNTCTFKFTPNAVAQNIAAFDTTNFLGLVSNSDGSGAFITNNGDRTISVLNNFAVGQAVVPTGFNFAVTGASRFNGSDPIVTVNSVNSTARFGANSGIGVDGVFFRGGFTLIESGSASGQILLNFDNQARDVSISGIGSNAKLSVFNNLSSKRVAVFYGAASQTANILECRDSTGATLFTSISAAGKQSFDATNTATGTTGAQTINKPSGTVNFAAGATSLVVTNNLVTTSSIVLAVVRTNDATAVIKNVVPASGSFTINLTAAATAETSVGFIVYN